MTLFSFAYIFVGSICFTLGCLHLLIYFRRQDLKVDLVFSLMAFAIALSTFLEIWTFKASSLTEYVPLFKATINVQGFLWICFAWFVHLFTRSSRIWPPALITALYSLAVIINFFSPAGILFQEITEFTVYTMPSGEIIHLAHGPANAFRLIADIAWIMFLVYAIFAFINYGRRGNARQAIISGATIFLCLGLGYLHGTLIDLGVADPPYLGSFLFLPLSLVMSFSLAGDVVKASKLSSEIKIAEARWRNMLENVHLLVFGIDRDKTVSYINPYFLKVTGYEATDILHRPAASLLPEKVRDEIENRLEIIFSGQNTFVKERRLPLITRSGEQREIIWSNVLLTDSDNHPAGMLSIGKDITDQLHAEAARDNAMKELESFKEKLEAENISLKEMIQADHGFKEIIGESNGLLYVLNKVQQVAGTDSTVLILGETGTGKELVARAIHQESERRDKQFIRVNCAAIPADLVESELFGHEPGSFTNAVKLRQGKFELAEGGTIFLDEISEMPLEAQAKLLTVLQENELERVGGSRTISVDARVISATNRDLNVAVAEGRFRADLYYRLNVYPLTIPPLRKRKEDIPLLVKHFISLFNKKFGKHVDDVPPFVLDTLISYDWPGNVRELKNILERAMITCSGSTFNLPEKLKPAHSNTSNNTSNNTSSDNILPLAEVERQHILLTLQKTGWKIGGNNGAAQILKINPSTLRSRIKKLGLKRT